MLALTIILALFGYLFIYSGITGRSVKAQLVGIFK